MRNETLKKTAEKPEFWGQILGTLIDVDAKRFFITYYVKSDYEPVVVYKIRVSRLKSWHFGILYTCLGRKMYFLMCMRFFNTPFEHCYVLEAWDYPWNYKF